MAALDEPFSVPERLSKVTGINHTLYAYDVAVWRGIKPKGWVPLSEVNVALRTSEVVKMLFVVVAVFATLWLPYRVLLVYNSFAEKRYMELWYLMFCKTMIFINSAINPILYNAMSIKFRRAFKRMLSCGAARGSRDSRTGTERTVAGTYSSVVGGGSVRLNRSTFVAPASKCGTSKNALVDTSHQLV
ncbi:bombesin receptor subtype-3-like [Haemaphysalis longicornis]